MKVLVAAAVGGLLALVVGLVILAGGGPATTTAETTALTGALQQVAQDSTCISTGPLTGLSTAQASNAELIVSVSDTLSHEDTHAAQIALMTSITETHLTDLDGGMGGAYGLFQQTPPAWGTVAQIMDPTYAATQFVSRLLAVPGWQSMTPWAAAQAAQSSGAGQPDSPLNPEPGVVGGNYAVHWLAAGQVLNLVLGSATSAGCGGGPTGGEVGPASRYGLPASYSIPPGTTPQAQLAVAYAISKLGDAYVWAAAGPNTFDCSGLTMMAWAQAGVQLAHYTITQMNEGLNVPASQMVPGDLVLVPGSDGSLAAPGHVGIYIGDSLVLSAVDPQDGVIAQSWATFVSDGLSAIVDPLIQP